MAEATYREIRDAAQAVNLCNAQQDVIRDLWAAVKASQALVGYAQSHLCLVGEDDVAREIAEEWAALIDKVFVLIATQMPGQWRAEFIPRSESLARCEETGSLKTACTANQSAFSGSDLRPWAGRPKTPAVPGLLRGTRPGA